MIDKEEILMEKVRRLLTDPFSKLSVNTGKPGLFCLENAQEKIHGVDDGDGNRYIRVFGNGYIYIPFDTGCESLYERKLRVGVP